MTQKTILTKEQIQQIGLSILPAALTPGCLIDFARDIEQAVLSEKAEEPHGMLRQYRAKHYGDGYQDGWNAAMAEAVKLIEADGTEEFRVCSVDRMAKAIRALKREQS